jgi:beta-lactamase class A
MVEFRRNVDVRIWATVRLCAFAAMGSLVLAGVGYAQEVTAARDVTWAIQERIAKSGADVGVVFSRLDGTVAWSLQGDKAFHAASTMKVPVMIELFHQAQQGKLKLDDPLPIRNDFHSIVDGSAFALDPKEDSEFDLYKALGQTRTLRQLCELMITISSNLATNLLIEKLGVENIRATVHALHADGMNVLRGVEDQKAFDKGLNNTTTAQGLATLLLPIAKDQAVDAYSSSQMIEILQRQTFNEGIPAGLPTGTRVAHKTGEITKIHHDAAIVFAPKPFVLVVLVSGMEDRKQSGALIADIAHLAYQATQR